MKICANKLLSTESSKILTHIMLKDSEKASDIAKTLEGLEGDERKIEVVALFNGVQVDGQVLEDWLQDRYNEQSSKLEKKYSDVEAEINERVEKIKRKLEHEYVSETIKKVQLIRDHLDRIELDLECL